MLNFESDIALGLQHGDEGKGKVVHDLLKNGSYTHCLRFNGGGNAGHTIYHQNTKFVTHFLPGGVLHGIESIIGPGCVLNVKKFLKELSDVEKLLGVPIGDLIKIAGNVHIITDKHLNEDSKDQKIGTTKTGNGPAYSDKYNRTGLRASDIKELKPFIIDIYEYFYSNTYFAILCEGAQGFELDIDWGDYPFVTSSHCGIGGVINNGIPVNSIKNIFGIAKCYETYVGNKSFQPNDECFTKIQIAGKEFGATTGRPRQCNWLNIPRLIKSINMNSVTNLIFNKVDILREVNKWKVITENGIEDFNNEDLFKENISSIIKQNCKTIKDIIFSDNPYNI